MNESRKHLLSVLQRGITHARSLSLMGKSDIAAELLDALDNIPQAVVEDDWLSFDKILQQLDTFDKNCPDETTGYRWMLENKQSISPAGPENVADDSEQ